MYIIDGAKNIVHIFLYASEHSMVLIHIVQQENHGGLGFMITIIIFSVNIPSIGSFYCSYSIF